MRRFMQNACVSLLLVASFAAAESAQACSGARAPGAFPLDLFIDSITGTIATGVVRTVSESGFNAVLNVDRYLRDPQPEGTLLLVNERPEVIELVLNDGRAYPSQCGYLSSALESERRFIANLNRAPDGSYQGYVITSDESGVFELFLLEDPAQPRRFTYEELVEYVETRLDSVGRSPERYTPPRTVEVLLTTETGEMYALPVDTSTPRLLEVVSHPQCPPWMFTQCTDSVVAPNGIDLAGLYPEGSGVEEMLFVSGLYFPSFEGETAVFSLDSNLIAVWTGDRLRSFALAGLVSLNTSNSLLPIPLTAYTAPADDPLLTGAGAWSPNGRTFAFSTQSGVWLWDVLSPDVRPTLFRAASEEPVRVRHFSPLGNFLAVESGSRRYHIDLVSGREYPDGQFSPDDRMLAAYDTAATGLTPLTLYTTMPQFVPAIGWNLASVEITQFEWITTMRFMYASCGDPINDPELIGFDQPWCKVRVMQRGGGRLNGWFDGTLFDYDPVTQSIGILTDADTIRVNDELIDLAGLVEGEIVSLELAPLIDMEYLRMPGQS